MLLQHLSLGDAGTDVASSTAGSVAFFGRGDYHHANVSTVVLVADSLYPQRHRLQRLVAIINK